MKLFEVNPFIRFASEIKYNNPGHFVEVRDCRIFYILSGNCEIFIDDESYTLNKNCLFYCCAGSIYKISSYAETSIISLNFDLSQRYCYKTNVFAPTEPSSDSKLICKDTIADSPFLNSHLLIKNAFEFDSLIKKILLEYSLKQRYYLEVSCGLLKQLLTELHRYEAQNESTSSVPLNRIIDYINNNFSKEITNKQLAKIAGYHEYHLNRLFMNATGTSMHQYILNLRMNKAQHLILNTSMPLSEIGELSGYNNYTYFSDYFKKHFGISPSKYRSSLKNKI